MPPILPEEAFGDDRLIGQLCWQAGRGRALQHGNNTAGTDSLPR